MKRIWSSKLFLLVLALKLIASFFFASSYLTSFFVPFLNYFVLSGFANPWEFFYRLGMTRMFPYPTVMLWLMTLPRILFAPFLPTSWQAVTALHLFLMRIPLLAFDFLLLVQLLKLFPTQHQKTLLIYWCSPLVFFVNYIHGQLDILPTALFFIAVSVLIQQKYLPAMLILALAAGSKNHVLIALPFVAIYLYKQRLSAARIFSYLGSFLAAYLALLAPYAGSEAFRQMVFNSPEQQRFFEFVIPISSNFDLVICPTVLGLLFLKFASYKKLNREIFLMFLGIVFALLVVLVPPMPGWFLWSFPFLVYFYMSNKDYSRAPFVFYNVIYLVYFLFFFEKDIPPLPGLLKGIPLHDLGLSIVVASVAFIAFWMYQVGVKRNEELKLREAPVLVGIGGDSASGKHTLARVLRNLFGKKRSLVIHGDSFHKWERGNENWKVYTHLDPSANRLHQHLDQAIALSDGNAIELVHYDHATGTFTAPQQVKPNQFILFVGLHPFYLKRMRELFFIKVYVDTDDTLRQYWKLRRDVSRRGYQPEAVLEQIAGRQEDRKKYIEPQKDFADLIIRYEPCEGIDLSRLPQKPPRIKAIYRLDNSVDLEALLSPLSNVPSLSVRHTSTVHWQELEVSGQIKAREVMHAAYLLGFNFDELRIHTGGWLKNLHGISQLVFLVLYNEKMKVR